jgi:hypothetical protein
MNEEECLKIGGHCWICYSANDVLNKEGNVIARHLVYYPNGEPRFRTCKHCGRKEKLREAEWEGLK